MPLNLPAFSVVKQLDRVERSSRLSDSLLWGCVKFALGYAIAIVALALSGAGISHQRAVTITWVGIGLLLVVVLLLDQIHKRAQRRETAGRDRLKQAYAPIITALVQGQVGLILGPGPFDENDPRVALITNNVTEDFLDTLLALSWQYYSAKRPTP